MAFCILEDGRKLTMPAEKLGLLWKIRNGEVQGTPEQKLNAKQVEKFYFNPETAPESWKQHRRHQVEQGIVGSAPWWKDI